MSKRKTDEESPLATRHKPPPLPPVLEDGQHDQSLFFSVVAHDIIRYLSKFLRRRVGAVKDPMALHFVRTLMPTSDALGLCFDAQDNLVVSFCNQEEICVYNISAGKKLRTIGAGKHSQSTMCVVDSSGQTYVSEYKAGCVRLFDTHDNVKREFEVPEPRCLALSLDEDRLYVACGTVKVFATSDGHLLQTITASPEHTAFSVAVLSTGQLAVSGDKTGRLDVLSCDGSLIRIIFADRWRIFPIQITVDAADNIYVANAASYRVEVFSWGGTLIRSLRKSANAADDFNRPTGIAISSTGVVAVGDAKGIHIFEC